MKLGLRSKTVNLQLFGLTNANLLEKLTDIHTLVALQLDHLAVLLMFDNGAVAREFLLEGA